MKKYNKKEYLNTHPVKPNYLDYIKYKEEKYNG